jgi:hypothetical protein
MDAGIFATAAIDLTTSFGREHFGGCQLGDKRLTKRARSSAAMP